MGKVSVVKAGNIACPHGFSTRLGGVSTGIYDSLNLGRLDNIGDVPERVAENWRRFGSALGIDTGAFVHGKQAHGNTVLIARPEYAHGITEPSVLEADGYVTDIPGLPLAVFTADCAPVLMHDPVHGVVAAVHCGWKPTAKDILRAAVEAMGSLGAWPEDIRAAIGPCIRKCCFQVGEEVVSAMDDMLDTGAAGLFDPDPEASGKYRLDLPGVIARRLAELGVGPEHIEDTGECTMCAPERYWSHRAMGMRRGSQANIIMLV